MSADIPTPAEAARYLLDKAQLTSPPVDLFRITKLWPGLHVAEEQINNEGYVVCLGVQGGEIILKASDTEQRKRYTLAHELGHWVLSNGIDALMRPPYVAMSHVNQEKWCDQFAAELMMPRRWLLDHLRSAKVSGLSRAIISLPKKYNASKQAMYIRVSEIAPLNLYILAKAGEIIECTGRYEHKEFSLNDNMRLSEVAEAALRNDVARTRDFVVSDAGAIAACAQLGSRRKSTTWIVSAFFRA